MDTLRPILTGTAAPPSTAPRPSTKGGRTRYPGPGKLTGAALAYYGLVLTTSLGFSAALLPHFHRGEPRLLTFFALAFTAAFAQLFTVDRPGGLTYKASVVFLLPAVFLLPPEYLVPLAVLQYVPDWVKTRKTLKVQAFNIAKGILDTLAAWGTFHLPWRHLGVGEDLRYAVGALVACAVYVFVNHMLLALITRFTRGVGLRETKLFTWDYLSTDLILAGLGAAVASLWTDNPWVVPFAVAPLVLTHRALAIPQLQAEARVDPKTGLFNARHFARAFAEELSRARRFDRPLALLMADLDLLRNINNTYGHLAGDAVLAGVAEIFRTELRQYDVASRFGGEEFSILLPETPPEAAFELAERIRARVAEHLFSIGEDESIHATISIGVSSFPRDGRDEKELIHSSDIAVYQAKLRGRNRVIVADPELEGMPTVYPSGAPETPAPAEDEPREYAFAHTAPRHVAPVRAVADLPDEPEPVRSTEPELRETLGFRSLPHPLPRVVAAVGAIGIGAGILGLVLPGSMPKLGLLALALLVALGQALSFELAEFEGAISVSAVGAIAGAALFDYRAALPLALAAAAVDWGARRTALHHLVYNVATLSLSSLASATVFALASELPGHERLATALLGLFAGAAYFAINMSLVSLASGLARGENPRRIFEDRFAWLLSHYVVYGFVGGVMAVAYEAAGLYALAVFAVPLVLARRTQGDYLRHTQRSNHQLREAANTISAQNMSLERANRLLRERSTAAMESLSATVDARDAYTAGHSRRVERLALALGRELGLSQAELDLLGHAALFHDIGKLAVPDSILLKEGPLTPEERLLMQRHSDEGARIIGRLGFLDEAVPWIRHHHESWDGTGYPQRLAGEEIPLAARIIHLADAIDSIVTTRIYRPARSFDEALAEVRRGCGTQFCPRCVAALERLLPLDPELIAAPALAAAS